MDRPVTVHAPRSNLFILHTGVLERSPIGKLRSLRSVFLSFHSSITSGGGSPSLGMDNPIRHLAWVLALPEFCENSGELRRTPVYCCTLDFQIHSVSAHVPVL